jgi:hypothetical protein
LTTRYDTSPNPGKKRGLVALSISKIINHEQKLLVAKDDLDLSRRLSSVVEKFVRQHEHLWQEAIGALDIRTIGVIVHFSTAAHLENENIIVTCQQIGLNNLTITNHIIGGSDDKYFMEIGYRLHKGIENLYGRRIELTEK